MKELRTKWNFLTVLLTVGAMLLGMLSLPGPMAMAQAGDDTYEFAGGQVLSWSGAWEIDPESSSIEEGLELVLLAQELSFLAVMSVPAGLDVDSTRDAFLEGFLGAGEGSVTIDRGAYGSVSYSLDTVRYDGVDMGAFTLFRTSDTGGETFAWIFVSLIDTFASEFAVAQSSFTLDGNPPFTGIEGQGLQDQLAAAVADGNVPSENDDAGETTAEDAETPDATTPTDEGDSGEGGLKGGGDAPTSEAETDEPTAEVDATTPEANDPPSGGDVGLIDESTYISPAYGTTVEWDASLVLNPDRDPNPAANTDGLETIGLSSSTEGVPLFVTVNLTSGTSSAVDYAEVWSSPDYLAENAVSPDAEVLLVEGTEQVAGVVYVDYLEDGTQLIFYYEFRVDPATGNLVLLEYYTAAVLVEDTLPMVQNGLAIDGDSALSFFSVAEILEAAGL